MRKKSPFGTRTKRVDVPLVVRIAERFVSPVERLQRLDMPDDVRHVAPEVELDAIIIDEWGDYWRRVRLGPPPPGRAGNRIEFDPIPIPRQARLWFFVIDASYEAGSVSQSC